MKKTIFLATMMPAIAFSQVLNEQNIPGEAERHLQFKVTDAPNDVMEIGNSTSMNNQFQPNIWAHKESSNAKVLGLAANITSAVDNGTIALIDIGVGKNIFDNGAPNTSQFPWGNGGTIQPIVNRPILSVTNAYTTLLLVAANGNIGMGTTSITAKLDVNGDARIRNIPMEKIGKYFLVSDDDGYIRKVPATLTGSINCSSENFVLKTPSSFSSSNCSQIYDSGRFVGINTITPDSGYRLIVNGDTKVIGSFFSTSDKKFKDNIQSIDHALDKVLALDGKTYSWKKGQFADYEFADGVQYGLIAQDVEKVIPELVHVSDENEYSLNYDGLIPVLIEAIKELNAKIEDLENQRDSRNAVPVGNGVNFKITPNPVKDVLTVYFDNSDNKNYTINIYDGLGKKLANKSGVPMNNTMTINLAHLPIGLYVYEITENGSKASKSGKIIKE